MGLGFANCFLAVNQCSFLFERPRAYHGLVQEVFEIMVRRLGVPISNVTFGPGRYRLHPLSGHFLKNDQSSSHIFASLRIVGRCTEHRFRPIALHVLTPSMKLVDGDSIAVWIAAYLIERNESMIAIKCRVFSAFGHDRAGNLLKPGNKVGLYITYYLEK